MERMIAAITAVGGFTPEDKLTNLDLEKLVDTNDEWITTRTGIKERRILKTPGWASSDMAVEAIKIILKKRNLDPLEIDLIIVATVTPDLVFPDTANTVADKIGAKNAFGFDLHAACSGFLYALHTGSKFIESGTYKKVLVVGVDFMSSIIDYTDRATCIIFGDGCGAVLLEPSANGEGIKDAILKSDGSGRAYLHMKAGGSLKPASFDTVKNKEHFVYQEGKTVFKFAVKGMISTCSELAERNQLSMDDFAWLVPHQANIRIIQSVGEGLNFPLEKTMVNIEKFGNTTAGTLPLCLWEYEPNLKKGDKIMLTAFGGGFTWGSLYLTWAID
jgi:3-oxoacyl-[acyl-carrier-protein] synthase III